MIFSYIQSGDEQERLPFLRVDKAKNIERLAVQVRYILQLVETAEFILKFI